MILTWHLSAFLELRKMIEQNVLPHALLITGVEKIGKFELSEQLIQTLLCKNDSCGECSYCRAIKKDNPRELLDYSTLIRRSHYPNLIYCCSELNDSGALSKDIRVEIGRASCRERV